MKTYRHLTTAAAVDAWVAGLWRTDVFKQAHGRPGSLVRRVVDQLATRPRLVGDYSEPEVEKSHFTTWFGVLAHREGYLQPGIHDLYYFHEIAHAATMTYAAGLSPADWNTKMVENEFEVSLMSEVLVYADMPGLRALSFDGDIWADRFLTGGPESLEALAARAGAARRRAMTAPTPSDKHEALLQMYVVQNAEFAAIWNGHYDTVERWMAAQYADTTTDAAALLARHEVWLAANGSGGVPFRTEAETFAAAAQKNRAALTAA